jgi:hypothetical protein
MTQPGECVANDRYEHSPMQQVDLDHDVAREGLVFSVKTCNAPLVKWEEGQERQQEGLSEPGRPRFPGAMKVPDLHSVETSITPEMHTIFTLCDRTKSPIIFSRKSLPLSSLFFLHTIIIGKNGRKQQQFS